MAGSATRPSRDPTSPKPPTIKLKAKVLAHNFIHYGAYAKGQRDIIPNDTFELAEFIVNTYDAPPGFTNLLQKTLALDKGRAKAVNPSTQGEPTQ